MEHSIGISPTDSVTSPRPPRVFWMFVTLSTVCAFRSYEWCVCSLCLQLRRLDSVSRSPIYSSFSEALRSSSEGFGVLLAMCCISCVGWGCCFPPLEALRSSSSGGGLGVADCVASLLFRVLYCRFVHTRRSSCASCIYHTCSMPYKKFVVRLRTCLSTRLNSPPSFLFSFFVFFCVPVVCIPFALSANRLDSLPPVFGPSSEISLFLLRMHSLSLCLSLSHLLLQVFVS